MYPRYMQKVSDFTMYNRNKNKYKNNNRGAPARASLLHNYQIPSEQVTTTTATTTNQVKLWVNSRSQVIVKCNRSSRRSANYSLSNIHLSQASMCLYICMYIVCISLLKIENVCVMSEKLYWRNGLMMWQEIGKCVEDCCTISL